MKIIAEYAIIPIGTDVSLSKYVKECEKVINNLGIKHEVHANGTNLEGDFWLIMVAVFVCTLRVHAMGVPRMKTLLSFGTRTDRDQTMEEKVKSVMGDEKNNTEG